MAIESSGHSQGNPRMFALIEGAPKTGKSPTIWAWPQITEYLKIAGQPVAGPWPPHQELRPDPEEDTLPVAVAEAPRPVAEAPRHRAHRDDDSDEDSHADTDSHIPEGLRRPRHQGR